MIFFFVSFFLSGCATVWEKPGATQSQFEMDSAIATAYAERETRNAMNGGVRSAYDPTSAAIANAIVGATAKKAYYDLKMKQLGWTKVKGSK